MQGRYGVRRSVSWCRIAVFVEGTRAKDSVRPWARTSAYCFDPRDPRAVSCLVVPSGLRSGPAELAALYRGHPASCRISIPPCDWDPEDFVSSATDQGDIASLSDSCAKLCSKWQLQSSCSGLKLEP